MDSKGLVDYLKTCYELEKSIYLQVKVVNACEEKLSYYRNYESRLAYPYNSHRKTIPREYDIYVSNPAYKRGLYTGCSTEFVGWEEEKPHSPDEVLIFIRATQDMKFGFLQSSRSKAQKKLDAYNEALREANAEALVYNEKVKRNSLEKVNLIEFELRNEKQRLENTKKLLQGFYGKNIIFAKYRSFIAISAILEYIISGRCSTLPEAYNKYEEELRQAIIIDKLDIIIDRLERVERSQYMLYDAIMTINNQLSNVLSGIDAALVSMSKIENNTFVSSYNTKIITDNEIYQSKLLTFDLAYRLLKDI